MRYLLFISILASLFPDSARAFTELKWVKGEVTLPAEELSIYKVTGESLVLWDKLVTPEEFAAHASEAISVPFPGVWSNFASHGFTRTGKATYRLIIHLPDSLVGMPLALWMPRSMGPSTFWLNGKKMIEHDFGPDGGESMDRSPGHNRIYVTPHENTLTLVIQNFNYHTHNGGFVDKFLIGQADALHSYSIRLLAFDFLVFGILIFSGVYHLWIFTFRRRFVVYRDLGLFFLCIVLRILCTGSSHWFAEWGLNEILIQKMSWISYYSVLILGLQTLKGIYPEDFSPWLIRFVRIYAGVGIAVVIITPLTFSYRTLVPMQILTVALTFPTVISLGRAYLQRRPGTLVLLPATLMLMLMGVLEIYNSVNGIDQSFSLLGMGVLMFSLGASVFQSLEFDRTFRMVEQQTDGIDSLNQKLRKQAEILERRIQQKTKELATLLHSLPEGVLLIESDERDGLRIGQYRSHSMHAILDSEIIDLKVIERFLLKTQLTSDQRAQLQATLLAVVGQDAISYDLNVDNLPQEIQLASEAAPQTFLCAWAPVILQQRIQSLLLVLVNVSTERSVYQHFEQNQQIFDRMLHLLTFEAESLAIFIQEALQIMQRLDEDERDEPGLRLRDLHTLKGLARSFGLPSLAKSAHEAEDLYLRQSPVYKQTLKTVWQSHREALQTLRIDLQSDPLRDKEENILLVAGQQLARLREPPSEVWLRNWNDYLHHLFVRADRLILSLHEGLAQVAAQLGKPMPQLVIEGGEIGIRRSIQGKLLGGLNHILRNALDHGLESPEERQAQGKNAQGSIFVTIVYREKIRIEVHDDGRGLNLNRMRERALEKGLITVDQPLSDEQIAQFVFTPGFSTKTEVNDISGRGIGMDAVQAAIRQLGGQIRIVWRSRRNEQGFRESSWSISLPRRYGFDEVPQ